MLRHRQPHASAQAVVTYTDGTQVILYVADHQEFVELGAAVELNHRWLGQYAAIPKPDPGGPRPIAVVYKEAYDSP